MNTNDNSRREFITAGVMAGLALAGCAPKKNPFQPDVVDEVKPSGIMVKLLSVDGEVIEVDQAFLKPVPELPAVSNDVARKGIAGKKFVMVIDLSRCKSLKKCQAACNHMHHIHPGQNWIKVYPMQDAEHTAPYWEPTTCMHCDLRKSLSSRCHLQKTRWDCVDRQRQVHWVQILYGSLPLFCKGF